MRRRAAAGTGDVERERVPNHRFGLAIKRIGQRGLWRIDRRPRVQNAADRTAAGVSLMGPGLVALGRSRNRIAVADNGPREGIGGRNAGRPACADRRKNLRRQRKQDYG